MPLTPKPTAASKSCGEAVMALSAGETARAATSVAKESVTSTRTLAATTAMVTAHVAAVSEEWGGSGAKTSSGAQSRQASLRRFCIDIW